MQLIWRYILVYEIFRPSAHSEVLACPPARPPILANAPTLVIPPPLNQAPGPAAAAGGGGGGGDGGGAGGGDGGGASSGAVSRTLWYVQPGLCWSIELCRQLWCGYRYVHQLLRTGLRQDNADKT